MAEQVQVFYWPTATIRSDCARASSITASPAGPTYAANATAYANQSITALAGDQIDVVNGFTYSYPSTYVSVVGRISVSNSCGVLGANGGKTLTNPTPVAVPAITTASYASWPSECRPQGNYVNAVIDILHQEDIACPTWGLSDPFMTTCDGDVYMTATEGPPYNPVILVPSQFLDYDPAWGACATANAVDNGPFILPCGVYDPPHALHAASAMVPSPTADPPAPTPPPAQPQILAGPHMAQPTSAPAQLPQTTQAVAPQPVQSPAGGGSNGDPNQAQGSSNNAQADPKQDPSTSNDPGNSGDPGNAGSSGSNGNQGTKNTTPNQGSGNSNSSPNQGSGNPAPQNSGNSNSSPNQGSGSSNGSPNQGSGNSNGSPGQGSGNTNNAPNQGGNSNSSPNQGSGSTSNPSNQGSGDSSGGSGGSNQGSNSANTGQVANAQQGGAQGSPQKAQQQPVPVAQTTINIGGTSQPSPAIGGFINGGFGGSPAAPGQTPSTQGGSTSGVNGASGNPGSSQGHSPNGQGSASGGANGGNGASGGSNGNSGQPGNAQGSPQGSNSGGNGGSATPGASSGQGSNAPSGNEGGGAASGQAQGSPQGSSNGGNGAAGGSGSNGAPAAAFSPHPIIALGQTMSAVNPSAVAIADKTLSEGGPAFSTNGNFFSLGPAGNLIAGTLAPGSTPAPALTFGGSTYTANPAGAFAIGSQTLTPGGAITVSGTPISLSPPSAPSNVAVIGTSSQSLITPAPNPAAAAAPAVLTFDGSTYTANSASQFVIAGKTLTPGGSMTVFGMPISAAGDGSFAVIGASTQSLQSAAATAGPAIFSFGGSAYTASGASQFVVAGQTLTPGGVITVSGTPISEAASGSGVVVIGSSTQSLQNAAPTGGSALLTFGGSTYTANGASQFVVGSQTLTPGGVITVSGTPISEASSDSGIAVVGSSTQTLANAGPSTAPPQLTLAGSTYTANSASAFVIASQTLTPGGVITVSGTALSEAPSGSGIVVVGSSTQVLGHASSTITNAPVMTFNGQTYTANAASQFVVNGQTLTPGGMIMVSGTPISEAVGASDVVIGSSTEALGTAAVTSPVMTFFGSGTKQAVPGLAWLFIWFGISMISGSMFLL